MLNDGSKKSLIIQAAIEVIKEKGFEKTAVSQIVRRAGVAQGTFYLYFQSKNELVPAIADMILQEQLDRIRTAYSEADPSLAGLLEALVDVTYDITAEYKELITFIYSGMAFYKTFETWERIYEPYYSWLAEQIASLRDRNEIKESGSIPYMARFTVGLAENSSESYYLSNSSVADVTTSKKELTGFLTDALSN